MRNDIMFKLTRERQKEMNIDNWTIDNRSLKISYEKIFKNKHLRDAPAIETERKREVLMADSNRME